MENNDSKNPSIEQINELWNNKNILDMGFPSKKESRVVDQYDREKIDAHIQRFAQHCAAKGINPTMQVIIDWLYSKKAFNERDDFVKIERLMEMVGSGQVYPLLIMEVLDYAKKVEKAAIAVNDELGHLSENFDSLKQLKEALSIRLEVRNSENEKVSSGNDTIVTNFVEKLKNNNN